jgi:1-aminocyclopropane-1-carboxylate deaminase
VAQEASLGVFFDTVITCTVTGSTQAGMIAGFAAFDAPGAPRPRRVLGIDGSYRLEETRDAVDRIARATAGLIGLERELRSEEVVVIDGYAHPRYGIPNDETLSAIRLAGRLEAMVIDPVYEGKSMHGLIDMVQTGRIGADSNVLYVHLGGVPALNGYSALFR